MAPRSGRELRSLLSIAGVNVIMLDKLYVDTPSDEGGRSWDQAIVSGNPRVRNATLQKGGATQ
jgi:hypothetical protein